MKEIPLDVQQIILGYLSSVDDYDSFDCDLLTRRRSRDLEEWTLFSLTAASRGDLSKLAFGWTRMDPAERRWVLFVAAAENQIPILVFVKETETQSAESWQGGLYWASLKNHRKAIEFSEHALRATNSVSGDAVTRAAAFGCNQT